MKITLFRRRGPALATALASLLLSTASPASEMFEKPEAIPAETQEIPAAPEPEKPGKVTEWSGRIGDSLSKSNYRIREKLSDLLFEAIDDIKIIEGSTKDFSYRADVHRKVFDNHDVANTYTVADSITMGTSIPIWSKDLLSDVAAGEAIKSFGISLGTSQGLELINLRQVRGSKLPSLATVEQVRRTAEAASSLRLLEEADSGAPILAEPGESVEDTTHSPAFDSLAFFDPLRRARYGNFWNVFSFPVRLPLTPASLSRLETGEIMSYNLSGSAQVGASVGWSVELPTVFSQLAGSVGYSVYLRGDFRVTVLKEDETHARVKLTRAWTRGDQWGVNAETDKTEWFEGFVIAGHTVGRQDFYIVPFRIEAGKSNRKAFDVGYRYDLTRPEARKAYQLAVLGRFAYSEELAGGMKGSQQARTDTGVEKTFTREQKVSTETFSMGVNYAKIWRHSHSTAFTNWDAVVTLPDGTRKLVTSDTQNTREWRAFFSMNEKTVHSFRVNVDTDRYAQGHTDALYLVAEANVDDSDTGGMELREYALEVENAVGDGEIFPRVPIYAPKDPNLPEEQPGTEIQYGRSSFYYRMIFSQSQVERFIHYPEEKMWEALEKAFEITPGDWSTPSSRMMYRVFNTPGTLANIPLYLVNARFRDAPKLFHADEIYDEWIEIRKQLSVNEQARALGHLFRDTVYSRELVNLLRVVLGGEPISYIASGTNGAFGRVWKQGKAAVDFYPLPDRIQREIDFDQIGPRPYGDDASQVSKIQLRALGSSRHELVFGATETPKAVYIRLYEDARWMTGATLGEWVVNNSDGKFQIGDNLVRLEEGADEPWAAIAKLLQPGRQYRISMAISRDGHSWGPLNTARYFVPAYVPASRRQ